MHSDYSPCFWFTPNAVMGMKGSAALYNCGVRVDLSGWVFVESTL